MNLAAERRKKGLTQAELAALTGLSRATIVDLESGKQKGKSATWAKLKQALSEFTVVQESLEEPVPAPALPEPLAVVALKPTGPWEGRFTSPVRSCGWCGKQHALGQCKV